MPTHIVTQTAKLYLNRDLTGGDRGTLAEGTQVTAGASDDTYNTRYILEPKKGWMNANYLKEIVVDPPPDPEPEPPPDWTEAYTPPGKSIPLVDAQGKSLGTITNVNEIHWHKRQ